MNFIETDHGSLRIVSQAIIINDKTDVAWAEKYIRRSEHNAWILGKYVEADRANLNRQFFPLEDLREGAKTLSHTPLNIGHAYPIVGSFVANELVYPISGDEETPFIEALSVMWKDIFVDEYKSVEAAYKLGKLAYSMETQPATVTCGGEHGCGETFEYMGRTSLNYCAHVNEPTSDMAKVFGKPVFTGGALIIPPQLPGWPKAGVSQVASVDEQIETYMAVSKEFSHLGETEWEDMMLQVVGEWKVK